MYRMTIKVNGKMIEAHTNLTEAEIESKRATFRQTRPGQPGDTVEIKVKAL